MTRPDQRQAERRTLDSVLNALDLQGASESFQESAAAGLHLEVTWSRERGKARE
jgi:hypothetical protein